MTSLIPVAAVAFAFGSCIGSFLNVCIYRIPKKLSIVHPGSACPHCRAKIPAYLNIPILSYLILRGQCYKCKTRISLRYPLVEAVTGLSATALIIAFGMTPASFFWFVFICVLIIISFIDYDLQIIPDVLSLPGIVVFATSPMFIQEISWKDMLLGIISGGGILYGVALCYYIVRKEEGMGGGDIKLLAMIGAATGWKGVLFTLFSGSLLGTVAGIVIMAMTRIADIRLRIPFGPYLSAGAVLYLFFGTELIDWYLGLL